MSAPPDLSKKTVPQLKAICKELGMTGYYKLNKSGLLQKLAEHYAKQTTGTGTIQPSEAVPGQVVAHASGNSVEGSNFQKRPAPPSAAKPVKKKVKTNHPSEAGVVDVPVNDNDQQSTISSVPENTAVSPITIAETTTIPAIALAKTTTISVNATQESIAIPATAAATNPGARTSEISAPAASESTTIPSTQEIRTVPATTTSKTVTEISKTTATTTKKAPAAAAPKTATKRKAATDKSERPAQKTRTKKPTQSNLSKDKQTNAKSTGKAAAGVEKSAQDITATRTEMPPPPLPPVPSTNSSTPVPISARSFPQTASSTSVSVTANNSNALRALLKPNAPIILQTNSFPNVLPVPKMSTTLPTTKTPLLSSSGKRFKALVVKPKAFILTAPANTSTSFPSIVNAIIHPLLEVYLEFPPPPSIPVLSFINFPPKVAQRKDVPRWSVILSGLENAEIRSCLRVSRMIRYSVYLSAIPRLTRFFSGRRLSTVQNNYSQNMTNMWPYLCYRESEMATRKTQYNKSFLAKLSPTLPISERLWTSPDDPKQATVAMRFILTRLWFQISVGSLGNNAWIRDIVVDAQEIIPGQIWNITTRDSTTGVENSFFVVESTCEVVGHEAPPLRPLDTASSPEQGQVREDWSAYIAASAHSSLLDYLKWTNHEEYDHGISKLWLARIDKEKKSASNEEAEKLWNAKKDMAERYVMACVVSNSLSGRWMSSTQMEQEFREGSSSLLELSNRKAAKINLFLPAHHHVESVHFTTAGSVPLHPALAVIQTPSREYFVLKDNGMQVGCEEDGVASIWIDLLGVKADGTCI